jgi:Protein of unknown function (DUF3800)
LNIYCDESGGVGRGVMTLAALAISQDDADHVLARFRDVTGLKGELKGSRIDLAERALLFEILANTHFRASVSIAISAARPEAGEDRGEHDVAVYAALLNDAITRLLPDSGGCAQIFIDDGRYAPETLALVRSEIAALLGPFGAAQLQLSHVLAGLQLADVIANSFFNRAMVSERQARLAAIVAPYLEDGRISMHILTRDTT